MAIENKLVQFGYGFNDASSKLEGMISFDASAQAIYVGDGSAANLVTSSVKDATFSENVLTITKVGGTEVKLDFSDVASADQTTKILGTLRNDINSNKTNINNLSAAVDASIKALDTSYKAADVSLKAAYEAADKAINDKIGTVGEGKTVVSLIEEAKNAANAAHSVVAKDSSFLTLNTSTGENGAITYTLGTSGIASDSSLAEVKATADAAAKQLDFNTHATNGDIHITAQERTDWNNAKSAIDAFLDENAVSDDVVNTLKEIQEYINGEGDAAEQLLKKISDAQDTADQAVLDASVAQAAANKAQGEVDALEGVVTTLSGNFDTHSKDTTIHITSAERTAWNAAEGNAKAYANSLASNYDKAGDASKAETAAKTYADAITVNEQEQDGQNITLTGVNIKVGGTGTNQDASLSYAVEDLYSKVDVASKAGVQSLAVNADSSKYAAVSGATGAVILTIKKVALADATDSNNTGVADAWDVKESIRVAKEAIQGAEGDASTAATVAGAKKYAKEYVDAQIEANALRWTVLS